MGPPLTTAELEARGAAGRGLAAIPQLGVADNGSTRPGLFQEENP